MHGIEGDAQRGLIAGKSEVGALQRAEPMRKPKQESFLQRAPDGSHYATNDARRCSAGVRFTLTRSTLLLVGLYNFARLMIALEGSTS